jgi:hypothetical protein
MNPASSPPLSPSQKHRSFANMSVTYDRRRQLLHAPWSPPWRQKGVGGGKTRSRFVASAIRRSLEFPASFPPGGDKTLEFCPTKTDFPQRPPRAGELPSRPLNRQARQVPYGLATNTSKSQRLIAIPVLAPFAHLAVWRLVLTWPSPCTPQKSLGFASFPGYAGGWNPELFPAKYSPS